jgi:hypothetical protein
MTAAADAIRYRRIRAPRQDGSALIEPSLPTVVDDLRRLGERPRPAALLGIDILQARARLLEMAAGHTSAYRDAPLSAGAAARPLILSGHQPTLFHPGVWFKNFLLSSLAAQTGGTAVNLVVDNDAAGMPAIRVPTGSPSAPRIETVPYDEPAKEVPFEERRLVRASLFGSFGERAAQTLAPLLEGRSASYTPLVGRLWRHAQLAQQRSSPATSLGWLLAEARHRLEEELGLATLELPLSVLCDADDFCRFALQLLAQLPRLRRIYNDSLAEYRAINHIRSRSHPVPDLAEVDGWLEAPFWIWSHDEPRRRHLFARRHRDRLDLSDQRGFTATLPWKDGGRDDDALEALQQLRRQGVKIRPRALVTTMFARLVLSDLFVHGIGGAKYDELTDAIIGRFFELAPPQYVTATATFQLPLARPSVSPDDLRRGLGELRDTRYHPERFADRLPHERRAEFDALAARKRQLIAERWGAGGKAAWHRALQRCNEQMEGLLRDVQARLQADQPRLAAEFQIAQRLGGREFSFCLFPDESLPAQLRALAGKSGDAALL